MPGYGYSMGKKKTKSMNMKPKKKPMKVVKKPSKKGKYYG